MPGRSAIACAAAAAFASMVLGACAHDRVDPPSPVESPVESPTQADLPTASEVTPTPEPTEEPEPPEVVAWSDGSAISFVDVDADYLGTALLEVEVLRSIQWMPDEQPSMIPLALDDLGRVLVQISIPGDFDAENRQYTRTTPVAVWAEDGVTQLGDTDPLVPDDPHRAAISGSLVGSTALWTESHQLEGWPPGEWRTFGQSLDGGEPVLLSEGHETSEMQRSAIQASAALTHPVVEGQLAWSFADEDADGMIHSHVNTVSIRGGVPVPLVGNAMSPAAFDDGWLALRTGEGGTAKEFFAEVDALIAVTPDGDTREILGIDLANAPFAPTLSAQGRWYALTIGEVLYVGEVDGDEMYRFATPQWGSVGVELGAICGEHMVLGAYENTADGKESRAYLFDLTDGSSTYIPQGNNGSAPRCAGEFLVWTEDVGIDGQRQVVLARWSE